MLDHLGSTVNWQVWCSLDFCRLFTRCLPGPLESLLVLVLRTCSSLLSSATTVSRRFTFTATAISSRHVFPAFASAYLISRRSSFAPIFFY